VAFKMLHANLLGNRLLRRRFRQEAELMQSWRHAGVVEVYDFVEDDRLSAAVMELVAGPSLEEYLTDLGEPLALDQLALLFRPLLAAMGAAHGRGIVHRDLKPRNVLLAPDGPKVSDFGIAKLLGGPTFTEEGTLLGSCRYMAPEQAQSAAAVDHRADIYSIGVMLYRAVTGRCPFDGGHPLELIMAHATQPVVAPSALRRELPPALDRLILDCLAKPADDRPPSCGEVARRLTGAISATNEPS
jgi:serine/threonine-protein kinase